MKLLNFTCSAMPESGVRRVTSKIESKIKNEIIVCASLKILLKFFEKIRNPKWTPGLELGIVGKFTVKCRIFVLSKKNAGGYGGLRVYVQVYRITTTCTSTSQLTTNWTEDIRVLYRYSVGYHILAT